MHLFVQDVTDDIIYIYDSQQTKIAKLIAIILTSNVANQ